MEKKLGTLIYSIDRVPNEDRKSLDPQHQFGIDLIEVKQNLIISYVCAAVSMPGNYKSINNSLDFSSIGFNEQHQVIQEILNNALFVRAYIEGKDQINHFSPKLTKVRLYQKIIKKHTSILDMRTFILIQTLFFLHIREPRQKHF